MLPRFASSFLTRTDSAHPSRKAKRRRPSAQPAAERLEERILLHAECEKIPLFLDDQSRAALLAACAAANPPPSILGLAAPTDTGVSPYDRLTNHRAPVLFGAVGSGWAVDLYDDGRWLGRTTAVNGVWQFTVHNPAEGRHTFTAVARNVVTRTNLWAAPAAVFVDRTLRVPEFSLAAASDTAPLGDHATTLPVVNLLGRTDPNSTVVLTTLGRLTQSDAQGWFRFNGVPLRPGANTFSVVAADPAGNIRSFTRQITRALEIEPPVLRAGLANDTGRSASDRITFDATVSGSVIDASPVTRFLARIDSGPVVSVLGDRRPDGRFALSKARLDALHGSPLRDGVHTLGLSATDVGGNTSSFVLTFTLDTQIVAPAFDLAVESDTGGRGDRQTTRPVVRLVGQTDADADVKLAQTGQVVRTAAQGRFEFADLPLGLGTTSFSVTAIDVAGNTASFGSGLTRTPSGFEDGLRRWAVSERGGTAGARGGASSPGPNGLVSEGGSFTVTLARAFVVPAKPLPLTIDFTGLRQDTGGPVFIKDAFEMALVDRDGAPPGRHHRGRPRRLLQRQRGAGPRPGCENHREGWRGTRRSVGGGAGDAGLADHPPGKQRRRQWRQRPD